MAWLNFQSYSIWLNFGIFAITAASVWWAGARIARYADVLADRTGLGKAFMGLLLLAAATSSPEISTTLTAALSNSPLLAVNNLFGGITMQTAILAGVDLAIVRGALTVFTPRPVLLLEGVLLIVLLGLALAGFVVGEFFSLFGVSLWTIIFFGGYLLSVYLVHLYEGNERWQPHEPETEEEKGEQEKEKQEERQNKESAEKVKSGQKNYSDWSVTRLILFFSGGTLVILAAGSILAQVGDVLASQTGGSQFCGRDSAGHCYIFA